MSFLRACDNQFVTKFKGISIPESENGQLQEVPAIWGMDDVRFEEQFHSEGTLTIPASLKLPLIGIHASCYTNFAIGNCYGLEEEGLNFQAHYGVTVWAMYESCRANILEPCILLHQDEKVNLGHVMLNTMRRGQLQIARAHLTYSFEFNVKLEKEND
jgi:hypothetical protein